MKKPLFLLIVIGTIAMIAVMRITEAPLSKKTPYGVISLELAFDTVQSNKIITAWTTANVIKDARINTAWDFLFIFFYTLFFFFCCKKLSAKFNEGNWKRNAGLFLSKAVFVSALLDVGENSGMFLTINGSGSNTVVLVTSICSAIKWGLVLLTIIYILVALFSKRQAP